MSTTGDNARDPAAAAATDTPRPFAGRISDAEHPRLLALSRPEERPPRYHRSKT